MALVSGMVMVVNKLMPIPRHQICSSVSKSAALSSNFSRAANSIVPIRSFVNLPQTNFLNSKAKRDFPASFSRRFVTSAAILNSIILGVAKAEEIPQKMPGEGPEVVFVAGATGNTGKRVVKLLLEKGVKVKAGVRNLDKAKSIFQEEPNLEFVVADVTSGVDNLVNALGNSDAVICATGFTPSLDLTAAWKIDNLGTVALANACKIKGINKFVLVSSILTNGAAWGQGFNSTYLLLNLFGLVLVAKLQAERYLERCGLDYTIVRPGGLSNDPPTGQLFMGREDTLYEGRISRDLVAQVAVEALFSEEASFKTVEIISTPNAPKKTIKELFASIPKKA